jgi:hypothetical protein
MLLVLRNPYFFRSVEMKTIDVVKSVESVARKIAKRETQKFPDSASVGDCVRQGDVYITLLDRVPDEYRQAEEWDLQLATGNTQGSRHVLDSRAGVTCYTHHQATEFDGPVLVLAEDRELTHPEHGNWILPAGTYGISYQRTQDALDRHRRVAD